MTALRLCQGAAPDLFFAGLRGYLRQHQYGNAAASDLWDALSGPTGAGLSG